MRVVVINAHSEISPFNVAQSLYDRTSVDVLIPTAQLQANVLLCLYHQRTNRRNRPRLI